MTRRRFFVPPDKIRSGLARLSTDQTHHLRDVLRLRVGDEVEVFDGRGNGYSGKIASVGPDVIIGPLKRIEPGVEPPLQVVLALALIKSDRFEWVLQKATELGVSEFVPLMARFCKVRIPESKVEMRLERWQRIIREACKQCRRVSVPRVRPPRKLADFLATEEFSLGSRFFCYERASTDWDSLSPPSSRMVVCIGPEGGWEPDEVKAAEHASCQFISLGPRVLRTETAAMAALAIFQFLFGDLGPRWVDD